MRIERENGEPVGSVWAVFTPDEARSLLDALYFYFDDQGPHDPGWHHHIGDDPASELTVAIESR